MNELIDTVLARSTVKHSYFHGEGHWRRVAAAGHALLKHTLVADPLRVFPFALFQNSMHLTDRHDPEHGPRAAVLVQELRDQFPLTITDAQIDTLV